MSIGIPIKILHESVGHTVTIELTNGTSLRAMLNDAEDNMNCELNNVTVTQPDGVVTQMERVFVRGSMIRFIVVPDMLKNAPMFRKSGKKVETGRGLGVRNALPNMGRGGRGGRGGGRF